MKTEKEELEKKEFISKQEEGKKTMNGKAKRRNDGNEQLKHIRDALQKSNHEQQKKIEALRKTIAKMRTSKTEAVKKLEGQIKILKAENDKLMKLKTNPTEPEELSQSMKEKKEIEELSERVIKSESDRKRLQEKLNKYITCKRRKYKGTKLIMT